MTENTENTSTAKNQSWFVKNTSTMKSKIIFLLILFFILRVVGTIFILQNSFIPDFKIGIWLGAEVMATIFSVIPCWVVARFWTMFASTKITRTRKLINAGILALVLTVPITLIAIQPDGNKELLQKEYSEQKAFLDKNYELLKTLQLQEISFDNTTEARSLSINQDEKFYEGENLELCVDENCTQYDSTKTYKNESPEIQKLVEITPKEWSIGIEKGAIAIDGLMFFDKNYNAGKSLNLPFCKDLNTSKEDTCIDYLGKYTNETKLFAISKR